MNGGNRINICTFLYIQNIKTIVIVFIDAISNQMSLNPVKCISWPVHIKDSDQPTHPHSLIRARGYKTFFHA